MGIPLRTGLLPYKGFEHFAEGGDITAGAFNEIHQPLWVRVAILIPAAGRIRCQGHNPTPDPAENRNVPERRLISRHRSHHAQFYDTSQLPENPKISAISAMPKGKAIMRPVWVGNFHQGIRSKNPCSPVLAVRPMVCVAFDEGAAQ